MKLSEIYFPLIISNDEEFNSFAFVIKIYKVNNKYNYDMLVFSHKMGGLEQIIKHFYGLINGKNILSCYKRAEIRISSRIEDFDSKYKHLRIIRIFESRIASFKSLNKDFDDQLRYFM